MVRSFRSLIMRIYRPVGLFKPKFQCIIHAHGEKYMTNVFTFDVTIYSILVLLT